jgi:hypothetical protein
VQGESFEGMKVELDMLLGEAQSDCQCVIDKMNEVQSTISKDSMLTDALIKQAKQDTQRLMSSFVAAESPYKQLRTTLVVHNKTVNQALRVKKKDSKALCEVNTAGVWTTTNPLCTYIKNLKTVTNFFAPESETIRAAGGLDHERLDGLTKRLMASNYFRTQVNFMTQHQLKDGVKNCCVTLSLRAMVQDVEDTIGEIAGADVLSKPKMAEKMKGAGWSQGFKFHLMRFVQHEFVGVTNWCAGEAFLPIAGEFRMFGIHVGKLEGTLAEQISAFGKISGDEVLTMCDFHYASVDGPRGLLVIPEGYIYTIVCSHGITLQWGFGCETNEDKSCTLNVVNQLLSCWPSMDTGDWKEWQKHLRRSLEVNPDA